MANIQSTLQNIPGYGMAVDYWNDYAGEHFQTKDPFVDPKTDKKLKAPTGATKREAKIWKKVQKRAWVDDKCFCGCYPVDCGLGLAPLVTLIPGLGPILMYAVHARLIHIGDELRLPQSLVAKMQANILFDLLITFPPLIGSFLSWLNGCSTRNAALFHTYLSKTAQERDANGVCNLRENV